MMALKALRECTREIHESLHEHPLLHPLTEPALNLTDYYYALKVFQIFYRGAEKNICFPMPDSVPNAPVSDWLKADLERAIVDWPKNIQANGMPRMDTLSKLMGYLYVKQGSTLGGQLISKNLQKALNLQPVVDQKFFAAYGAENGAKWQAFTKYLKEVENDLVMDEVLCVATQSFEEIALICNKIMETRHANNT